MEFQSPFVLSASSYIRRWRVSLLGPRTKSWRGGRMHVETSRMAGESVCSGHEVTTKSALVHPVSFDFFNRYSCVRIRPLPCVNTKCILCILSLLSSIILFFFSPFPHYYTVRLTLRGLRACDDVRTLPLKTVHVVLVRMRCF